MDRDSENSNVDRLIDENLRRVYDSVLQEDVPDRFALLLQQLQDGDAALAVGPDGEGEVPSADRTRG